MVSGKDTDHFISVSNCIYYPKDDRNEIAMKTKNALWSTTPGPPRILFYKLQEQMKWIDMGVELLAPDYGRSASINSYLPSQEFTAIF